MKTEVKKLEGSKKEISVEVNGDVVKNKFEDVFMRISKEAKVPGFRPGHAPRDILEKNFSGNAHQQVLEELIPDIYHQAIEQEKIDAIDLPQITDVKLERNSLSFKATVEIKPEIKVKDYKGIKVNYQRIEVTADEIKRNLDSIKESRKVAALDDNFAKSLGYPNLAELERALERQIFLQKENMQRQKVENEIIESILKDLDFKVPKSLIDRQLQDLLRQTKVDLALKGIPRDKIDAEEETLKKELAPEAQKQVRVYLVLAEIAKKENIALDDHMPHHVMELLLKEANWVNAS